MTGFKAVVAIVLAGFCVLAFVCSSKVRTAVRYLFHLRFPILLGLGLVFFPFFAFAHAEALLGSLFAAEELWPLTWVTYLALLAGWGLMATTQLIYRYAPLRCAHPQLTFPPDLARWGKRWRIVLFALVPTPMIFTTLTSSPLSASSKALAITVGVLLALATLFLSTLVRELFADPHSPPADLFFTREWTLLQWANEKRLPEWRWLREKTFTLFKRLGPGYFDFEQERIRPGHLMALALLITTILVYLLIGLLTYPGWAWNPLFPPLGYLIVLVIIAIWALPALSFLLDRWRIPSLLVVILVPAALYGVAGTEHYFQTVPRASAPAPTPEQALRAWLGREGCGTLNETMIVVAASGGGITASAWTAQVLTRLEDRYREAFTCRLFAISAVSGGSVGTIFYVDGFSRLARDAMSLDSIRDAAADSSLHAIAWGIAYPDLWRFLVPPLMQVCPSVDRGWAWETVLERRGGLLDVTLGNWAGRVASGQQPLPLLNAVDVETGQPFLFAPTRLGGRSDGRFDAHRNFLDEFASHDVTVVTATRVSSAFPWVLPLARPSRGTEGPNSRLTDGGYLDNFGTITLVEWLRTVGPAYRALGGKEVLLVQIKAFEKEPVLVQPPGEGAGWGSEVYGPISTMMRVRSYGQNLVSEQLAGLLEDTLRSMGLALTRVEFPLLEKTPLSWSLTQKTKGNIEQAWMRLESGLEEQRTRGEVPTGPLCVVERILLGRC